ncbi:MAG: hypothetical protein LBG78_04845 [Azoarcus sp.]|jgi:hypothetical protein|nr:hypothetical protein [Azoarcus sp.]
MAISRCNHCGYLREVDEGLVNEETQCPQCGTPCRVYQTVFFVDLLIKKHKEALNTIKHLQSIISPADSNKVENNDELDIFNTTWFSSKEQHKDIFTFFKRKNIEVQISPESVDTRGFYDEIALEIGNHYNLYREVINQICWAYRKNRPSCLIHLKENKDADKILEFSKKLYDASLISKKFYDKEKVTLKIVVQSAQAIRNFFNGLWLEWYALMLLLMNFRKQGKQFSCTRNLFITLPSGDKYELDIFALIDNIPVLIECKTGEFRHYIEKCQHIKKALHIYPANFILCIVGLDTEKLDGFSAMHHLTFSNEITLLESLKKVFGRL